MQGRRDGLRLIEKARNMHRLFKSLIGRFTGMTKPYPKGTLVGHHVGRVEDIAETFKRANELTKKYGGSVIFLDEIDRFEGKNEWTTDWPTAPGWYWFYGRRYGEEMHSLGTVEVSKASNGVIRVLGGAFMYRQEKHVGVFQRIPAKHRSSSMLNATSVWRTSVNSSNRTASPL